MKKRNYLYVIIIALIILIFASFPTPIQAAVHKGAVFPTLKATNQRRKTFDLTLHRLDARIRINGMLAETRITLSFYNPHEEELEGHLTFPVPENAFISGYALDVNGKMVDGVAVEKKKADNTYRSIVRKRIDPGLVEQVGEDQFKTRVYPILPKKSRTIMIRYISQLEVRESRAEYSLPLMYRQNVNHLSIMTTVNGWPSKPLVIYHPGKFKGFRFKRASARGKSQPSWQAGIRAEQFPLEEDLGFAIPLKKKFSIRVETAGNGDRYFSIHRFPIQNTAVKTTAAPKRVTILWDASGSREKDDHLKEKQMIYRYFSRFQRHTIRVDLVVFRIHQSLPRQFMIRNGNCRDLLNAINSLQYDGATSEVAVSPIKNQLIPDLYMLFSDGRYNFKDAAHKPFKAPVYIFSTSRKQNAALFRRLAAQSGGRYFQSFSPHNCPSATPDYHAVTTAMHTRHQLFRVSPKASLSAFNYYPAPTTDGVDVFLGRLEGNASQQAPKSISLYYWSGNQEKKITFSVTGPGLKKGDVVRTFWARKKIQSLSPNPFSFQGLAESAGNKKELIRLGKSYGLATPFTSLIVLESLEQYVRYRIKPPRMLPEMREKYEAKFPTRWRPSSQHLENMKKNHFNALLKDWQEDLAWWRNQYPGDASGIRNLSGSHHMVEEEKYNPDANTSSISGVMTVQQDSLPGVMLKLYGRKRESNAINYYKTTVSNVKGSFTFNDLAVGDYNIFARLEGFKTEFVRHLDIKAGMDYILRPIDMELELLQEHIIVAGRAPVIDFGFGYHRKSYPPPPATTYLEAIKSMPAGQQFQQYLLQKKERDAASEHYFYKTHTFGESPWFYLDCGRHFFETGRVERAVQILSNIAELETRDPMYMFILARWYQRFNFPLLSAVMYKQASNQTYAFGTVPVCVLAAYHDAQSAASRRRYGAAIKMFYRIGNRFGNGLRGIRMHALTEMNRLIKKAGISRNQAIDMGIDQRFLQPLDADIRILMSWDNPKANLKLWLFEPGNEITFHGAPISRFGGTLSTFKGVSGGQAQYILRKKIPGNYSIRIENKDNYSERTIGAVLIRLDFYTNYGRGNETCETKWIELQDIKSHIPIEVFRFEGCWGVGPGVRLIFDSFKT